MNLLTRLFARLLAAPQVQIELRKAVTAAQAEQGQQIILVAAQSKKEAVEMVTFQKLTITSPEWTSLQDRLKARQYLEISHRGSF